jgi:transposase
MWTSENRLRYERRAMRYPSDLKDEEFALVKPLIPPAKRGGRRRGVDIREILSGLLYVLSTGCQWAAMPKDLPPKSTVYDYFDLWIWDGTLARIHDALHVACREQGGLRGLAYSPDAVAPLFTEDAIFEGGRFGNHLGRPAICDYFAGVSKQIIWAMHYMINPIVEIDDDWSMPKAPGISGSHARSRLLTVPKPFG